MTERASLLLSSGNGPAECRRLVAHLLQALMAEADLLGLDCDIAAGPDNGGDPASVVMVLSGLGAQRLAEEWEGVVLWRCPSPLRPRHPRKNWFAQIFRLAPAQTIQPIDPDQVEMQAIRAGGPGGQHQNKTSSAIRARWTDPKGQVWSVVVRDSRSQHANRRAALDRLSALIAADQAQGAALQKAALHGLHSQIQRGAPRRSFQGPDFKPDLAP